MGDTPKKECIFVGLGTLGKALVEVLVRSGYSVLAYNRTRATGDSLVAALNDPLLSIADSLQVSVPPTTISPHHRQHYTTRSSHRLQSFVA